MGGPFDSAWLKWARGVLHAYALYAEIETFKAARDRRDITIGITRYNAKRHGFVVEIAAVEPYPATWGVVLGDAANNLRSALDHIAWAMVHRGQGGKHGFPLSEGEARSVYFPIVREDAAKFNAAIKKKLIGVTSRSDKRLVRNVQPYHLRSKSDRHALAILETLCQTDKHRTVQPVHMAITKAGYSITKTIDCERSTDTRLPAPRHASIEAGAELGVIRVRKTGPNPVIEAETNLAASPGVTPRSPLDEWLRVTVSMIQGVLLNLAPPPDELTQFGPREIFFPRA
jgi:hypothetical protein